MFLFFYFLFFLVEWCPCIHPWHLQPTSPPLSLRYSFMRCVWFSKQVLTGHSCLNSRITKHLSCKNSLFWYGVCCWYQYGICCSFPCGKYCCCPCSELWDALSMCCNFITFNRDYDLDDFLIITMAFLAGCDFHGIHIRPYENIISANQNGTSLQ